jgi:hypothetical protein
LKYFVFFFLWTTPEFHYHGNECKAFNVCDKRVSPTTTSHTASYTLDCHTPTSENCHREAKYTNTRLQSYYFVLDFGCDLLCTSWPCPTRSPI